MPSGNIRKNYIYTLSFQIFSLLIPFITTPYVSRVLLPEGIGTYGYANSIATYFSLVAALGISSYGLREVSRCRDDRHASSKLFWELSVIRIVTTALCLLLYLGFIIVSGSDMRLYLACGMVILSVGVDSNWYFQAMEEFRTLMLRNFIVKGVTIACIFLFVRRQEDLMLYILIQGGGTFLSNFVLRVQLLVRVERVPWRELQFKRHIKDTLVYFIPTIATSVYTVLDRTMIGAITHDMAQNGYYEQAHKIITMLMTVITSLNVVVGVRTSYLFGQDRNDEVRRHMHDTFRFMFTIAFPMAAGMIACANTFVPWFFGPGYEQVTPLLRMFTPLFFIIGISNVLGSLYLTPSGQRARSNRAIIAGAVCNFVLNMILIRFFGVYGAVVASVVAETLISTLYLRYSADFVSIPHILGLGLRYLLLSGVMFVPTYLIGRVLPPTVPTTLLQVAVGVAVYAVGLVVLRDPALDTVKQVVGKILKKS